MCRYGSNLEEFDQDGYTPLLLAARRGFLDLVQHFVLKGANINARVKTLENIYQLSLPHPEVHDWLSSIKHFSKLHVAASLRRADVVTARTGDGDTALLLACYCGHVEIARWILGNGGSVKEANNTGLTPLISAANGGHIEVAELLLEYVTMSHLFFGLAHP